MYRIVVFVIVSILSASSLAAEKTLQDIKTITVKKTPLEQTLYFNGTIKPIKNFNVASPAEGVIVEKNFSYGQRVKKNENLVFINSTKLETDYHNALSEYLKSKNTFNNATNKLQADEELFKLGIIPENDFKNSKTEVATTRMAYLQSLYNLEETVKTGQQLADDIRQLDISDFAAVDRALKIKYNNVSIPAPASGIALLPPKDAGGDSGGDSAGSPIAVGSQVKFGQIITSIGDLSGISADVSVNELDVQKVEAGLPVTLTGVAFPGTTLRGHVERVGSQASTTAGASGGLPMFPVKVTVPKLTKEQIAQIRVGMSAKIALTLKGEPTIMIPISEVKEKNGQSIVRVLKDDKVEERVITTGVTTKKAVQVLTGLKVGEKVVVGDD